VTPADDMNSASEPRILIVADLHLDQWKHAGLDPLDHLDAEAWGMLDGMIIAGDLSNSALRKWPRFLDRLAAKLPPDRIHVFPGNHDFFDLAIDAEDRLAGLCHQHGLNYAQQSEVVIGGRRFLCTTLWTDFSLPADPAAMDDFRRIQGPGGGVLRVDDLRELHRRQVAWLDARLDACGGEAAIVTHHVPHPSLVPPDYSHPGGFASDLGWLMRKHRPQGWLFGHAHGAPDGVIEGVECRNVGLGPPSFRGTDASARLLELIT